MLPRHHAFRIGCALSVIAGIYWLPAMQRARVAAAAASSTSASVQTASTFQLVENVDPASTENRSEPPLARIHALLDQQRKLNPGARGQEDEIRRALHSLLSDENAAKTVQALSADDLNSEFGIAALTHWAKIDSLAASMWLVKQQVQSGEQTWAVAQAINQDPLVLEVLCERLPAGPWREALLENCCRAALADNPATALTVARQLQPGAARNRALLMIADEWTLREPAAAARWIADEPDRRLRDELLAAASAAQASTDPVGALSTTLGISSPGTFERSIAKITAMWGDYEPERAQPFTAFVPLDPISPPP